MWFLIFALLEVAVLVGAAVENATVVDTGAPHGATGSW